MAATLDSIYAARTRGPHPTFGDMARWEEQNRQQRLVRELQVIGRGVRYYAARRMTERLEAALRAAGIIPDGATVTPWMWEEHRYCSNEPVFPAVLVEGAQARFGVVWRENGVWLDPEPYGERPAVTWGLDLIGQPRQPLQPSRGHAKERRIDARWAVCFSEPSAPARNNHDNN